jgi:coenzyme F420-reducing hydrogenase delta subunit
MCSGRVDLKHILLAFANGVDGMFVGGCHINDCHYNPEGNYDAMSMVNLCRKLLEHIGINPKRLRLEWVSAGEGIRFANIMNEFAGEIGNWGLWEERRPGNSGTQRADREIAKLIPT